MKQITTRQEQLEEENRCLKVELDTVRYALSLGLAFIRHGNHEDIAESELIQSTLEAALFRGSYYDLSA